MPPLPLPAPAEVSDSHESLTVAFQPHPLLAEMVTVPLPPEAPKEALAGTIE